MLQHHTSSVFCLVFAFEVEGMEFQISQKFRPTQVQGNYHCYLNEIISGGVTYQNKFTEIIFNFMRGPYTSGIGQTMQKYFLGWELFYRGQTP